jgi:hypothetical protein
MTTTSKTLRPAAEAGTRFDRYECKYLLSEWDADRVAHYVKPFVATDPFAERSGGRYEICSLYLDSPDLRLYQETIEGQRTRYKLRIRGYNDNPEERVFCEIKRRHNGVISKTRVGVSREVARNVVLGIDQDVDLVGQKRANFDEFVGLVRHLGAIPIVLVRYEREPYAATDGSDARVTFDRRIMCSSADVAEVRFEGPAWTAVRGQPVLLELKFNGICPYWMTDVIQRFELRRTSFSKYALSVDAANNPVEAARWAWGLAG